MKYEDMQDVIPEEAPEWVLDIYTWARMNPDRDLPAYDEGRWTKWREEQEELQERAAELWALLLEAEPAPTREDLASGAIVFPGWYGEWWVPYLDFLIWSERLREAIKDAEVYLGIADAEIPTEDD